MHGLLAGHDARRFNETLRRLSEKLKADPLAELWAELEGVDPAHRRIIDLLVTLAKIEGQAVSAFLAEAVDMAADGEPLLRLVK